MATLPTTEDSLNVVWKRASEYTFYMSILKYFDVAALLEYWLRQKLFLQEESGEGKYEYEENKILKMIKRWEVL